ncbi:tyrosine-type recombinase/integrase [Paraburkholderia unamae]|uniref:Site-specific recombinase XerD n=1 Tax=Paraburkholderia unamae TaxID=219649 RepID=A0ABX5K6Y2_9BURK|nr:tyrosine-type recombinase/integrase [Paraburkholderia unamae]PVX61294.1 site-specific recombinase XerD [Paraburkholderia unamae]
MAAARKREAKRRNWPENLYENGKGYLWFRHPDTGETFGLGRDFKSAAAKVRTVNAELARRKGDTDLLERIDHGKMTLAKWCDEFEEAYKKKGQKKADTIKTVGHQINAVRNAPFAAKQIREVTTNDIATWIDEMAKKHPTMASLVHIRARNIFRSAEAKGHIELGKNPVAPTEKPHVIVTRSRMTLDDFNAVLAKVREAKGMRWLENAMLLGLVCGQRREDLSGMLFSQVKDGFLWVQQSKGKSGYETKLRIPLALYLPAIGMSLDDVLKQCRDTIVSRHVIHHVRTVGLGKPGSPVAKDSFSEVFKQYRDLADLKLPAGKTPTTFHEIRSLSARLYTEAYGKEFAKALLGHKSAKMTALYTDSRGQEWQEVKLKAS